MSRHFSFKKMKSYRHDDQYSLLSLILIYLKRILEPGAILKLRIGKRLLFYLFNLNIFGQLLSKQILRKLRGIYILSPQKQNRFYMIDIPCREILCYLRLINHLKYFKLLNLIYCVHFLTFNVL